MPKPKRPSRAKATTTARSTTRGHKDAARIGAYLARHALAPDAVLVSTARRTRETWDGVAQAWSGKPAGAALRNASTTPAARQFWRCCARPSPGAHSLLVIGHNPGMQDLARLLIASGDVEARERLNEGLPTSGLTVIDFASGSWAKLHPHGGRLERFVTPRSLAQSDSA